MTAALTCCVVLLLLLCATVTGDVALASARRMTSRPTQKHHYHHHHLHLDQDQDQDQAQDQNLQFMLGLYRSAAGPDGRLKQYRKFGSNTVRLLRPSVTSVRYLSAWRDHHYTFTVEYSLDSLPLDQLVRASFLHFRSPSSSRSPWASHPPPPCKARVHYLGVERHPSSPPPPPRGEAVSLEPHHQWTETEVTAHVSQHILRGTNAHLTLMAQYRCTDPGYFSGRAEVEHPSWRRQAGKRASTMRWRRMMQRRRRPRRGRSRTGDVAPGYHLEVPSLLLYLEEQREGQDWLEELLAGEDQGLARLWWPHRYASHNNNTKNNRYRRSSSSSSSNSSAKDPPPETSVDLSKDLATLLSSSKPSKPSKPSSSKSSSSSSSSSSSEPIPGRPNYRRKTGVPRNRCRLHSFRLSFEDLGLGHYFIAPPVYNPRYCQGVCPPVLHAGYHSPYHAIIQTVMRELAVGEDVPAPSCVPYKYMPMSVLVRYKSRVEYRELEDMIAESCTCR